IGVIIFPVTSGDTAFRSARMIIADYLNIPQKKFSSRLMICIPLFAISVILLQLDFQILWRYFSWANQALAMIALWSGAVYLALQRKTHLVATLPAAFITTVVLTDIFNAKIGFGLTLSTALAIAAIGTLAIAALLYWKVNRMLKESA